eukprot:TRINITY_DN1661_c0_g1_i1.p1 TRINITY_DN1661_c0_g1~~TRINITY_DN1661_c0_g1_i1.p1  ORF type:complete len:279 (+),score=-12.06 TRINITY_DN1661_c0_g1_i1:70-906(+)
MGDTDLALYEVKLRALFAGLYTQARSSKQRVNYKIATKELLQFCKLTNLAVNKEECKSILKSKSTDGKIKFEEFFYCFKKLAGLGDTSSTPEIPTLSLDPSPRAQRKKSVVIDHVVQEFLITPRNSFVQTDDPRDSEISYDTDSDKELSISSGGSPSSSTTDVSGLLDLDSVSPRKDLITSESKLDKPKGSAKLDSFSALSLIMTMVFSILSFLASIIIGPSMDSSLRAGVIGFLLLCTAFLINRPKFYQRSVIILAAILVFWSAQIVKFGSNKLLGV